MVSYYRTYTFFEAIVGKLALIFQHHNTLAAGLVQATQPEMGVILQVIEGEIFFFHEMSVCSLFVKFYQNLWWEVCLFLKIDNFIVKACKRLLQF